MRPRHMVGTALAISAAPGIAFAALYLKGQIAPQPALLGFGFCALTAVTIAAIWARDVHMLSETIRQAALENASALSAAAAAPRLPSIERATRNIERLSRTLANRAAMVGQLLAANEAIVERLPDPLLVLGPDRGVRRANEAARAAYGSDMAAVLRHPDLRAAIERAYHQHATQTAEFTLPVPVQREVAATVIFMDPPLADGGQAIVVLSDRSRERALERMRADFIANASHELRTPLASLIGFIATLQGPAADDPAAQQRFLAIMAEQAERMNRLIDDLMSLSRIELTEHQPLAERVDLASLVDGLIAGFEPRIAAQKVHLTLDLPPHLPHVIADADQLAQVASNLIDNALKYGRPGGKLRVSLAVAAPGGRWPARRGLVLAVTDDGRGIAREHIPRLTERFYRVDKARSRNNATGPSGTGLGLAIIKHILNRHRGQLAIDSEEGKGSTFSVWLPIDSRIGAPQAG
jgi:two-component system phosphate regulon sensor histidine kinase PhoR